MACYFTITLYVLDKLHRALGVRHLIAQKKNGSRRKNAEARLWPVSLISLVRSFLLHTSTIISARGSKWPFLGTKATGSSARKKEEIFRARSFLGCSNVRGRFLSPGTVVAASYSARWRMAQCVCRTAHHPPSMPTAVRHVFRARLRRRRCRTTNGRTDERTNVRTEWVALLCSRPIQKAARCSVEFYCYYCLLALARS